MAGYRAPYGIRAGIAVAAYLNNLAISPKLDFEPHFPHLSSLSSSLVQATARDPRFKPGTAESGLNPTFCGDFVWTNLPPLRLLKEEIKGGIKRTPPSGWCRRWELNPHGGATPSGF